MYVYPIGLVLGLIPDPGLVLPGSCLTLTIHPAQQKSTEGLVCRVKGLFYSEVLFLLGLSLLN